MASLALHKHKEAEITKCLKWGSRIVVRIKGEREGVFSQCFVCWPHRRNLCVFYSRTLDLQMNKWREKRSTAWAFEDRHTNLHTMPQWGAIGMVVALSHNPLAYRHKWWEAAISVLCLYTYSRSQKHTSWLFHDILSLGGSCLKV